MRIYDLFYEISTILGGIENKSYQLLDKVNGDNEEKYIITKKKFNAKNLLKFEDQDAEDENRIIQCMKSISNHRFQNLSEVRDFRSRFQITSSNSIPVDTSERLILKKSWPKFSLMGAGFFTFFQENSPRFKNFRRDSR